MPTAAPRPYLASEANYKQLLDYRPNVAVLPWGATEAHNYHLPHTTDVIEASEIAAAAAAVAYEQGGKPIVLPPIPFGNNAQQLDQVATIHLRTTTALAILDDVAWSLKQQRIRRLLIVNAHGGNEFKPLVRDLQQRHGGLIVVADFWRMMPRATQEIFPEAGDHAGELETALLLHLCPQLVQLDAAGPGKTLPFQQPSLQQPGVWTPRPWSKTQPDTGAGDPSSATAEKGNRYFDVIVTALAKVIEELSKASDDALP